MHERLHASVVARRARRSRSGRHRCAQVKVVNVGDFGEQEFLVKRLVFGEVRTDHAPTADAADVVTAVGPRLFAIVGFPLGLRCGFAKRLVHSLSLFLSHPRLGRVSCDGGVGCRFRFWS